MFLIYDASRRSVTLVTLGETNIPRCQTGVKSPHGSWLMVYFIRARIGQVQSSNDLQGGLAICLANRFDWQGGIHCQSGNMPPRPYYTSRNPLSLESVIATK